MSNYDPEDRPEQQPIRARVPDHVSSGAFSTGVIVMTAHSEFILDFVQNLGRPHQIVSRVIMPHHVLPQLVDALQRNIELYKSRWGELPQTGAPPAAQIPWSAAESAGGGKPTGDSEESRSIDAPRGGGSGTGGAGSGGPSSGGPKLVADGPAKSSPPADGGSGAAANPPPEEPAGGSGKGAAGNSGTRQASAQEIYDDLKIRDELLSGSYANAVMIGHGAHEFSFDFITNFYPHSAVSARVFLSAGQIPRLFDSLKGTWAQLKQRMQPPPPYDPPYEPPQDED